LAEERVTAPLLAWTHAGVSYQLRETGPGIGVLVGGARMIPVSLNDTAVIEWLTLPDAERAARAEQALAPVRRG
jgi:hypothetical protein